MCFKVYSCSTILFSSKHKGNRQILLSGFFAPNYRHPTEIIVWANPQPKICITEKFVMSLIDMLIAYIQGKNLVSMLIGCIAAPRYSMSSAQSYSSTCWYIAKVFSLGAVLQKCFSCLSPTCWYSPKGFSSSACWCAALPHCPSF